MRGPEIARLLQAHLDEMHLHSPPESVHALDLEALRRPEIAFWTAWDEAGELLGCVALKRLDEVHGEVKSMRTAAAHMRKGVATRLMRHLLQEARQRGYRRLSLETGSPAAFDPARRLYRRFGFVECGPFADYKPDPNSVFMALDLEAKRVAPEINQ